MIDIDGVLLRCADIVAVARAREQVALTAEARLRATRSNELAERIAAVRPVYGRSTGVGANRDVGLDGTSRQALALLRSHATSAGRPRAPERVRAMLVVRLNQLAAGGSGASPALLDSLVQMLSANALPAVRELGSIGTGDLPALATIALALAGETATSTALPAVRFGAHDALSFMSSNAGVIGDSALACADLDMVARAGVVVAGLTFTAVQGNPEAFSEAVERVTPFAGSQQVCRWMRSLTEVDRAPARIQDSFGLRTMPQVHGALLDALGRVDDVAVRLANAPAENPVVLPGEGGVEGKLAHHGGFHAAYLGIALDAAGNAAGQSATLVLSRLSGLNEPALTGQQPFLGDGTPGASGAMMLEYVAASALADLRLAALPSGAQSVVLSRGVEEDASFASHSARKLAGTVPALTVLVACELVAAMRALRFQRRPIPRGLQRALHLCVSLPTSVEDRDLSPDIEAAESVLPALAELL